MKTLHMDHTDEQNKILIAMAVNLQKLQNYHFYTINKKSYLKTSVNIYNMESNNTEKPDNLHEFLKLLKFMRDLLNTFPEYKEKIGEEMLVVSDK